MSQLESEKRKKRCEHKASNRYVGAVGRSIAVGAVYPLFIEALALSYERSLVVRYRSSDLQTKANDKALKEKSFDSNPYSSPESRVFRSINSEVRLSN